MVANEFSARVADDPLVGGGIGCPLDRRGVSTRRVVNGGVKASVLPLGSGGAACKVHVVGAAQNKVPVLSLPVRG